jgi:cell division protein FtsB
MALSPLKHQQHSSPYLQSMAAFSVTDILQQQQQHQQQQQELQEDQQHHNNLHHHHHNHQLQQHHSYLTQDYLNQQQQHQTSLSYSRSSPCTSSSPLTNSPPTFMYSTTNNPYYSNQISPNTFNTSTSALYTIPTSTPTTTTTPYQNTDIYNAYHNNHSWYSVAAAATATHPRLASKNKQKN